MNLLQLPAHKCSLSILHNLHKDNYETVEDYTTGPCCALWKNDEAKARAIATDEIWEIQWFPHTPVGSICIAAPTLEEALEFATHLSP